MPWQWQEFYISYNLVHVLISSSRLVIYGALIDAKNLHIDKLHGSAKEALHMVV